MITTTYSVLTPCGLFDAHWDEDEEIPVQYAGTPDAIAYFQNYLELTRPPGRSGALVAFDTLQPVDLYGFCQSEEYGVTVLPTVDDLIEEVEEMNTEEQPMTAVMDSVDDADTFLMIGEGAQILGRLDEDAESFFADLGRLREILLALGSAAPTPEPTPAPTVPEDIARRVKSALDLLREISDGIAAAKTLEAKFGAPGRYQSDAFQNRKRDIDSAQATLATFRKHAPDNGVDAEAFIVSLGGEPDLTPSPEALAYMNPQPAPAVTPEPEPAPAADPTAEARAFLQTVIDGSASMGDVGLPAELGKVYAAHKGNADMEALFKQAVDAYSAYAITKAKAALAK